MKVFHDVLDRKLAFLDDQMLNLKSGKIRISPKGLVHGFGKKICSFFILCFVFQISP